MWRIRIFVAGTVWLLSMTGLQAALLTNGGFESGLDGWRNFWSREANAGTATLDSQISHSGKNSVRIAHRGAEDWSFEPQLRLPAKAGDLFEMEAWVKVDEGSLTLCASTWDDKDKNVSWSYGERNTREQRNWFRVRTRFVVPAGVTQVQPRIIGHGPVKAWVDDVAVQKIKNLNADIAGGLPETLTVSNNVLKVTWTTSNRTFVVTDLRTGQIWAQKELAQQVVVKEAQGNQQEMRLKLLHLTSDLELEAVLQLVPGRPEYTLTLSGQGELPGILAFPAPVDSPAGNYLVVPMNEGISYPVEDQSIETFRLVAYGGHGICMAFWGVTDGNKGQMTIIETPDDASIHLQRIGGKLAIAPEWEPQKQQFGYARRLRYVFFDQGGHVAMCKRYRAYAKEIGLLKTLAEKRQANTNVDLLIGAVNAWCWDRDSVGIVKEMQAAGIDRILWSNRQNPANLKALNELGVLTSRYDIYQDVMNPENFKNINGIHSDWTTEAWSNHIVIRADGSWLPGWAVKGKDDKWYPCGVICDKHAPDYARKRIPAELANSPYRCRFIDTTTAAPWHECYSPEHPMTRSESRHWKMELLRYVSEDCKLVTGCETGHDASVPFLHYFEGMLSLGPYRVPDSGRDMQRIWTEVPERVVKFQLGHAYRLPLWELVYHDCVVAQWYWGDYNNKLPSLWDKRDLFNLLYGTPPMFMFNRDFWQKNKERFVQSYKTICLTVRKVGYSEMTSHQFLTSDRNVQQTVFANNVAVTVNFGDKPFKLGEQTIAPMGYFVGPAFRLMSTPVGPHDLPGEKQ